MKWVRCVLAIYVLLLKDEIMVFSICFILQRELVHVFFFQAEDGIRDYKVTGVQTCALPILLANHPATMHHLGRKLCQRFVSDDPPDGCVDDAVAAWQRTRGDIREVLRAVFHGPDFWSPVNVRAKVKTPLEFVVSAARATAADPDTTPRLAQMVARLGEPLYLHVAPDGYPEQEDAWVNSGALLDRMNAAVVLAAGRLPGAVATLDSVAPVTAHPQQLIADIDDAILGGTMSENTKRVIGGQVSDIKEPGQARAPAVWLQVRR